MADVAPTTSPRSATDYIDFESAEPVTASAETTAPAAPAEPSSPPPPPPAPPAPPAEAAKAAKGVDWDKATYAGDVSLIAPLVPDIFKDPSVGWNLEGLAPFHKQKEGSKDTSGWIGGLSGGGTFGTPGSSASGFAGIRLWNLEGRAGLDYASDGTTPEQAETLGLAWTKYKVGPGGPDLLNPLYSVNAELKGKIPGGLNTFTAGFETNLPIPRTPLFAELNASYVGSRSDEDSYFNGFSTIFNGGPLIPEPPEGMVATHTTSVSGATTINLDDWKSQTVRRHAMALRGGVDRFWDGDDTVANTTTYNGGVTFYFPTGKELQLKDLSRHSTFILSADLAYGRASYLGEFTLPSTGDTTDPFTGLAYDPAIYRGEEELGQVAHEDKSLSAKVTVGGNFKLWSVPLKNGMKFVFTPELGYAWENLGTSETAGTPVAGIALSLKSDDVKFKR